MKMLLTDSGITNDSIRAALLDLLGKPIAECTALAIPTAAYGHPRAGFGAAYRWLTERDPCPMIDQGWKSMGVLELTALPSLPRDWWVPQVEAVDALLVGGGDAAYLCHWLRESGVADLLPSLPAVWVGLSGGSMVMTPRIGADFVNWPAEGGDDQTLGLVDFSIFPHLNYFPDNSMANAEEWAAGLSGPSYAIDYNTAIKVTDGNVEVISEGEWKQLSS